jgi:hypothetical protein
MSLHRIMSAPLGPHELAQLGAAVSPTIADTTSRGVVERWSNVAERLPM